jgi:hypothetical protein
MSIFSQVFGNGFDPNGVEPLRGFDVLSPGTYQVIIEKAEVKETKESAATHAGNAYYLEVCFCVTDGPYRGRKLWNRLNIRNPSIDKNGKQTCQAIGQSMLSSLCKATGLSIVRNENELLGKSCVANVTVKGDQNEIRSWSSVGGVNPEQAAGRAVRPASTGTPAGTQPHTAKTTAAPTGTKPPWVR